MTTTRDLLAATSDLPPHEVERLLRLVTGADRIAVLSGVAVTSHQRRRFEDLVARRLAGEPLQYLEGTVVFGPVEVVVDRRVLVPRPETEGLFELVVAAAASPRVVVDLCTGSGVLALALKTTWPQARVLATELSPEAAEVARDNVARTGLEVEVLEGDLFAPLPRELWGRVDVVVANPPYVAEGEVPDLPLEVREHEPRMALVAGPRGDEVLARVAAEAGSWLAPRGLLACEIGERQADRARQLFARYDAEIRLDLTGRPRYVLGRR